VVAAVRAAYLPKLYSFFNLHCRLLKQLVFSPGCSPSHNGLYSRLHRSTMNALAKAVLIGHLISCVSAFTPSLSKASSLRSSTARAARRSMFDEDRCVRRYLSISIQSYAPICEPSPFVCASTVDICGSLDELWLLSKGRQLIYVVDCICYHCITAPGDSSAMCCEFLLSSFRNCAHCLTYPYLPLCALGFRSPFSCKVDYSGDIAARSKHCRSGRCFDALMTPEEAAAKVMEGVNTMKVSGYAMLEALACLEANAQVTDCYH
jgi:hypothetical protein